MPGLAALVAARLLFGISQAGAYPIAARINSLWMPFHRRAFGSSMVALGGRLGGALAPIITVLLIELFGGWRPVFWYYALLGVGWSILFWHGFRATPADHPACNDAEAHLIESSRPATASSPHGSARSFPVVAALSSLSLWMQCLMQLATNVAWIFLITWLPFYFIQTFHTEPEEAGLLSGIPLLGGVAGCFLGGIAADLLTRRLGLRWGRSATGIAAKVLATAGLIGAMSAPSAWAAALWLAFFAFATDLGMGATWAYFQDAGGPFVGTLLGWANMFGNLGAFLSPLLVGGLVGPDHDWTAALTLCTAATALGALCWLGVNASIPIVPVRAAEPGD
jgi:nitrate/nitrite transporter NarK